MPFLVIEPEGLIWIMFIVVINLPFSGVNLSLLWYPGQRIDDLRRHAYVATRQQKYLLFHPEDEYN
jgi:hypothetical protein